MKDNEKLRVIEVAQPKNLTINFTTENIHKRTIAL